MTSRSEALSSSTDTDALLETCLRLGTLVAASEDQQLQRHQRRRRQRRAQAQTQQESAEAVEAEAGAGTGTGAGTGVRLVEWPYATATLSEQVVSEVDTTRGEEDRDHEDRDEDQDQQQCLLERTLKSSGAAITSSTRKGAAATAAILSPLREEASSSLTRATGAGAAGLLCYRWVRPGKPEFRSLFSGPKGTPLPSDGGAKKEKTRRRLSLTDKERAIAFATGNRSLDSFVTCDSSADEVTLWSCNFSDCTVHKSSKSASAYTLYGTQRTSSTGQGQGKGGNKGHECCSSKLVLPEELFGGRMPPPPLKAPPQPSPPPPPASQQLTSSDNSSCASRHTVDTVNECIVRIDDVERTESGCVLSGIWFNNNNAKGAELYEQEVNNKQQRQRLSPPASPATARAQEVWGLEDRVDYSNDRDEGLSRWSLGSEEYFAHERQEAKRLADTVAKVNAAKVNAAAAKVNAATTEAAAKVAAATTETPPPQAPPQAPLPRPSTGEEEEHKHQAPPSPSSSSCKDEEEEEEEEEEPVTMVWSSECKSKCCNVRCRNYFCTTTTSAPSPPPPPRKGRCRPSCPAAKRTVLKVMESKTVTLHEQHRHDHHHGAAAAAPTPLLVAASGSPDCKQCFIAEQTERIALQLHKASTDERNQRQRERQRLAQQRSSSVAPQCELDVLLPRSAPLPLPLTAISGGGGTAQTKQRPQQQRTCSSVCTTNFVTDAPSPPPPPPLRRPTSMPPLKGSPSPSPSRGGGGGSSSGERRSKSGSKKCKQEPSARSMTDESTVWSLDDRPRPFSTDSNRTDQDSSDWSMLRKPTTLTNDKAGGGSKRGDARSALLWYTDNKQSYSSEEGHLSDFYALKNKDVGAAATKKTSLEMSTVWTLDGRHRLGTAPSSSPDQQQQQQQRRSSPSPPPQPPPQTPPAAPASAKEQQVKRKKSNSVGGEEVTAATKKGSAPGSKSTLWSSDITSCISSFRHHRLPSSTLRVPPSPAPTVSSIAARRITTKTTSDEDSTTAAAAAAAVGAAARGAREDRVATLWSSTLSTSEASDNNYNNKTGDEAEEEEEEEDEGRGGRRRRSWLGMGTATTTTTTTTQDEQSSLWTMESLTSNHRFPSEKCSICDAHKMQMSAKKGIGMGMSSSGSSDESTVWTLDK